MHTTGTSVKSHFNADVVELIEISHRAVNIGALSTLATTFIEKHIDFWAAYVLPLCALCISLLTLALCRTKLGKFECNTPAWLYC